MNSNNIKRAVDSNLSGLRLGAAQQEAIMQRIYGGAVVKRKLTLSMALVLVLLLVTAVGLAAVLLGGKEAVDQFIAPMAKQNESINFSKEEVEEILAFAEKQNIPLDAQQVKNVRKAGSYPKEEIAMLFAKAELGFYPSTWDVADQHWFYQFRMDIKDIYINYTTIPQEGELSQEEIEAKAIAHIKEKTGRDFPLSDRDRYELSRSFTEVKLNPFQHWREWQLSYSPLNPREASFLLTLSPQGEVKEYNDNLYYIDSLGEADASERMQLTYDAYMRKYEDRYGSMDSFTQENWQALKADLLKEQGEREPTDFFFEYVLKQDYGPTPEGSITAQEAIDLAIQALSDKYKISKEKLLTEPDNYNGRVYPYTILLIRDGDPIWKVSFGYDYLAEVDALSKEVKVADVFSPGNAYYRRYVLDSLLPQSQRAYAAPRPKYTPLPPDVQATPYPQPRGFEAPQAYWDTLQAIGYNGDTAGRIWDEANRDYGEDTRFWPLNLQALNHYRFERPLPGDPVQDLPVKGIPLEGDISVEQAREAALKRLKAGSQGIYEESYLDSLQPAVSYYYDALEKGSHSYEIAFIDVSGEAPRDIAVVSIDAISGEPRSVEPGQMTDGLELTEFGFSKAVMGENERPAVYWHPDIPDYYWEIMDKRNDSYGSVVAHLITVQRELGENPAFWPLMDRALLDLWTMPSITRGDYGVAIAGLPKEGDITADKAVEIAWKAFRDASKGPYTEEDYQSLTPVVGFYFNARSIGGRTWEIEFADGRREGYHTKGTVSLDAATGEVIELSTEAGNG